MAAGCLKQVMQLVILSRCSRVVRCTPKIVTICKLFVYSNIKSRRKSQLRYDVIWHIVGNVVREYE